MPAGKTSSNLTELALRRAEVLHQIERLLLRRAIVGEWTPGSRVAYRELREEERDLKARTMRLQAELCDDAVTGSERLDLT
jgi:hypothetical protein